MSKNISGTVAGAPVKGDIRFYENNAAFSIFSNVAPIPIQKIKINYEFENVASTECIYQASKNFMTSEAEQLLRNGPANAQSSPQAKALNSQLTPGFHDVIAGSNPPITLKEQVMDDVLMIKATQNPSILRTLLDTDNLQIVEDTHGYTSSAQMNKPADQKDAFWGNAKNPNYNPADPAQNYNGNNALGKSWMRVREKLRNELATTGQIRVRQGLTGDTQTRLNLNHADPADEFLGTEVITQDQLNRTRPAVRHEDVAAFNAPQPVPIAKWATPPATPIAANAPTAPNQTASGAQRAAHPTTQDSLEDDEKKKQTALQQKYNPNPYELNKRSKIQTINFKFISDEKDDKGNPKEYNFNDIEFEKRSKDGVSVSAANNKVNIKLEPNVTGTFEFEVTKKDDTGRVVVNPQTGQAVKEVVFVRVENGQFNKAYTKNGGVEIPLTSDQARNFPLDININNKSLAETIRDKTSVLGQANAVAGVQHAPSTTNTGQSSTKNPSHNTGAPKPPSPGIAF